MISRMRLVFGSMALVFFTGATACQAAEPISADYVSLLNGMDISGWQTTGNWYFDEERVLTVKPKRVRFRFLEYAHFLWSKRQYDDFVLDMEFKIGEGGNSGVFVRCAPPRKYIEVQIADSHGKNGDLEDRDCGGIVDAIPPSRNMAKPPGQWNRMIITCDDVHVQVELNGEQVVDLNLADSPKKNSPEAGFIGLQDYGHPVWFRNVRIKELN